MIPRAVLQGGVLLLGLLLLSPTAAALPGGNAVVEQGQLETSAKRYTARVAKRERKRKRDKGDAAVRKARRGRKGAAARRGKGRRAAARAQKAEAAEQASAASADERPIVTTRHGPARVDFDDRLIQGQANKTGTIYIFERKSSDVHSMVRRRTSFRDEIMRTLE